jgi:CubicO group peptidase (beta-lactamase class C family)
LVGDGVHGARLLPPERVRIATVLQTDAPDVVLDTAPRRASGYGIGGVADSPTGTRPTAFGHGGSGGPHGFADPEVGLAVGLTRTTVGGVGALGIVRRVRDALGVPS